MIDPMQDIVPILLNRANNFGKPCSDLLRQAAEIIQILQHHARYGRWPEEPPLVSDESAGRLE
jgi:hypothetical protein